MKFSALTKHLEDLNQKNLETHIEYMQNKADILEIDLLPKIVYRGKQLEIMPDPRPKEIDLTTGAEAPVQIVDLEMEQPTFEE